MMIKYTLKTKIATLLQQKTPSINDDDLKYSFISNAASKSVQLNSDFPQFVSSPSCHTIFTNARVEKRSLMMMMLFYNFNRITQIPHYSMHFMIKHSK